MKVLFERHMPMVLGTAMHYMREADRAEDVTMEIFEKVMKVLHRYEVSNFKHWILMMTRNHCLKILNRALKRENELFDKRIDLSRVEYSEETDLSGDENIWLALEGALDELKAEQRMCITLFYLQDMSYQEISSKTGFTLNEVKSHLQNGKLNLQKKLSPYREQ